MYKVFVNENPIILTEKKNFSTEFVKKSFSKVDLVEIVEKLFNNELNGICLISSSITEDWERFKAIFKVQKAAGGKVFNKNKEILFIYRFKKWDLPKGKLEKGETIEQCAIREVEEECGVSELIIEKELPTTYHIFKRNGKTILKVTYWFLMKSTYIGKLQPQLEEGIEKVEFKNETAVNIALENTYKNIKLLFN
ncbi:NUDIX domain-containing protein [Lutibacter sp. TH_r2]|uniref:NUDIX hydrolase n=1 Tax=Lutibacter sp. TH_r2 TaxID=3082083 RepID=UPI0029540EF4|nr:NUDIX domain-containing protein [Lutibacter sp. TH_r2]MDV7187189.1 NUDIX domain-containing protein [Lutibacter sp. TH_r2]